MSTSVKSLDPSEELISDRFWDVRDPVDKPYYVVSCQNALRTIPAENSDFHTKIYNTVVPSTLYPVPSCPEFVSLCAQYYSNNEKVITNSLGERIICKIDSQTLKETLGYSEDFFSTSISFDEAETSQIYKKASN